MNMKTELTFSIKEAVLPFSGLISFLINILSPFMLEIISSHFSLTCNLLRVYYVPGTMQDSGNTKVNEIATANPNGVYNQ